MRTLHKIFGKSMLASICIVGALIIALFPAAVVGAGSSESGFHISQWTGERWEEIYQHQFEVQYSTEAFTVDVVDGEVALRIVQVGTPFADIDQISLMVDGEELTPEYARYTESGQSIVEDILESDNNVVLAHEQEIEISWDVPAGYDSVTVYLTANEYGHGLPFRFPEIGYATYEVGSNMGSITVDGLIPETDGTVPLYCPYWQPSSGHPDGYTYIYVCDDEQYVYFSLDVTIDNTNEYGEDWAEIKILKPDGSEQVFRIDDFDNTWGKSGFGLTSKVTYKHQTCEFAIPKSMIDDNNIKFGLAYYGTASINGDVHADADVDPLVIEINGDSSSGQVFNVGDTINVEAYVHSVANASVDDVGEYLLETTLSCDLWLNPGNLEHDWHYEANNVTSSNYTEIGNEYNDSLSFTHTLTIPGVYSITSYSIASAAISYSGSGSKVMGSYDSAQETLSFTVVKDRLFMVDAGNSTIYELDPSTGAVVNNFSTPVPAGECDGLAYGNGRMFYVCCNATIYEIDPSDGDLVNQFAGPQPASLDALGFSGNRLYGLEYGENATIHVFNPDTGANITTLHPGVYLLGGLTFAGSRDSLFASDSDSGNSTIYEINAGSGAVLNSFPAPVGAGGGLLGLGFSSSRNTLFLGFEEYNLIYEVDPDDGTVINSFLGPLGAAISALAADEFVWGSGPIVNGSFETGDYTGWTLLEFSAYGGHAADCGTWGIASDGQTISCGDDTWDFFDEILIGQCPASGNITYHASDGEYLAYQLQECEETHRMYQDITLSPCATTLYWDMWYTNWAGEFDSGNQSLAVHIRDISDDSIEATLFQTINGTSPAAINMTPFSADISAFAGQTVRLDLEMNVYWAPLDAAFDNFRIRSNIDQSNEGTSSWHAIHGYRPTGQEFVPSVSTLEGVEVYIRGSNLYDGYAEMTANIRSGNITGPILASKTQVLHETKPDPSTGGWVYFQFDSPASVSIGNLYVLELSSNRTGHMWFSSHNNSYADGSAIRSGVIQPDTDYAFRTTYGCTEEPCLPVVGSVTETAFDTNTITHNVSMPTAVDAGDLLIVLFTNDGYGVNATTPVGWNLLDSRPANGCTLSAYYRVATGIEGGTGVDITTSNSEEAVAQVYRITNWHGTTPPEISTDAVGLTASPDPYGLNPSGWDLEDTLWIAVAGQEFGGGSPTYPTDYVDGISTISSNHTTRCGMHSAIRINTVSSENPGPFGIGDSAQWVAYTIAVRPPVCAGGTTCETFYSDGEVNLEAYDITYNTVHDAGSADQAFTTSLWIGQDYSYDWYYIERDFFYFDTSAIPDGAVITSASLHLYGGGDYSDSDFSLVIVNGQPTYPHDPYELGDYNITQYTTSPNGGELSTTGFVVDGYNTIDLNATGMGWINKTGTTKLGIFSSTDVSGTAPIGSEIVAVGSSADEGHEPYLEVCYTTGGGDTPPVANDNSVGTAEDTSLTFAACNFPYTDVDGDARTAVKIMSLPAHGTLNYSGSTFTTPYIIDEADISNLTFEPAANEYGSPYTTFGFQVQAGGAWSANTATMTIAVSPVNDEPSFTAGSNVTVDENSGAYSAAWACGISPGPSNESGQAVAFHLSNDNNSLFSSQPAISPTGTLTFTPAANVTGSAAVDVYLQDDGGTASGGDDTSATVQFTINVTPVNDCPVIDSVSPASQTVQFSDLIDPITIVASDADGDTLSLYGVPYGLNAVEGPTNTWNISGQFMDDHAMDWIIGVTDGECETPAATIASLEECVIVRFDNHNPMSVEEADAGDLTTAEFTVHIKQDPDGYLGWADLASGDVEMDIVPVGGGPTIDMDWVSNSDLDEFSEGAPVSFTFVPESGASFPIGTYIIEVTVNNDYYKVCGGAESLLMVYDPDVGASGSGTFEDCGDTYSFAFLVDYNKKGKNLRGSLVVIRELSGGGIYRIQSNALYDLALIEDSAVDVASFSGKCTYIGPDVLDDYGDPQNVGGQEFVVYLEDYDTSSGPSGTPDRFWFTVLGRDFTLDFDGDNQVSALEPQDLTSGDIIVPNSKPNMAKPKN